MPFAEERQFADATFVNPSQRTELDRVYRQKNKANVPREPPFIVQKSMETAVFIYNASPWPHPLSAGSMGSFYLPALADSLVLKPELCVAGPLVIPGLPSEVIKKEGFERVYHAAPEGTPDADDTGYQFAREIIGGGMGSQLESDLTRQGVFISRKRGFNPVAGIPVPASHLSQGERDRAMIQWIQETSIHYNIKQRRYDDIEEEAARVLAAAKKVYTEFRSTPFYKEGWLDMVRAAQQSFRGKCERMCAEGNMAQMARNFHTVNEPRLFAVARYIGKTPAECPWMEHSGDSTGNSQCWACGTVIKAKFKCPTCGVLLVTQTEYDAELKKRAGGAAA